MLSFILRPSSRVIRGTLRTSFKPLGSIVHCRPSPHVLCRPPPPIAATLYVLIEGTKGKGYSEASLKKTLTMDMANKAFQQTLRDELVHLSDLSGGMKVMATKCILEASTRGTNPDIIPHYTSRLFDATSGRYLGGVHSYGTARPPTFVSEKRHGSQNKWKGSVFPDGSRAFLLK